MGSGEMVATFSKKYYFYSMKTATTTKKPVKKAAKKAKPKPGSYEAVMAAIKYIQSTGVKPTWVKK